MTIACLAFRENSYAAPVVKIARERGHRVVSTGPYACVRHPMYAGALLFFVGTPLLLGSWYGLAATPVLIVVLAARALMEERTLAEELPGYREYAQRVRYSFPESGSENGGTLWPAQAPSTAFPTRRPLRPVLTNSQLPFARRAQGKQAEMCGGRGRFLAAAPGGD
jgi:hypothetical protein